MRRAGFVSILGRPNAGKSTLLNALLGQKLAIVSSRPQTTRTSIQGVLTLPEAQLVFIDTPGIHKSDSLLNKRMMDTVRVHTETDVALFLIDALAPFTEQDAQAVDLVKKIAAPVLAVVNKIDRLERKPKILELIERYRSFYDFAEYIPVSALTGEGLDTLRNEIINRLPEGPLLYPEDHLTDQPERFLAAEILREKILQHTREEVPHAVAVLIESWEDKPALLRIAASIYVERQGQKTILIGAGGSLLKKIGTLARRDMEQIFGKKVFLQTFVKVRPGWREDPEFLAQADWRSMAGT
ncbi:MAG: GTPase Era [Bryobacterales bacterium]|nr:GTPase Era [Bryobacterales bacterium]MBV9397071.1 GTPase Era [Bryobacterales bacterium]